MFGSQHGTEADWMGEYVKIISVYAVAPISLEKGKSLFTVFWAILKSCFCTCTHLNSSRLMRNSL